MRRILCPPSSEIHIAPPATTAVVGSPPATEKKRSTVPASVSRPRSPANGSPSDPSNEPTNHGSPSTGTTWPPWLGGSVIVVATLFVSASMRATDRSTTSAVKQAVQTLSGNVPAMLQFVSPGNGIVALTLPLEGSTRATVVPWPAANHRSPRPATPYAS